MKMDMKMPKGKTKPGKGKMPAFLMKGKAPKKGKK